MKFPLIMAVAAAFLLGGCSAQGIGGLTVVTHGEHRLITGQRIPGWVAVGGGLFEIDDGASVEGNVLLGDGRVVVRGTIAGDMAVVGGLVEVAAGGTVQGEISTTGTGAVVVAPGATVAGGIVRTIDVPRTSSPAATALAAVGRAVVLTLLVLAVRRVAPARVRSARRYLAAMPGSSTAYGFLVALVGLSLIVFMVYTLVLVPVALLGILALGLAAVVGLSAALDLLAERLGPRLGVAVLALAVALVPELPVLGTPMTALALLALVGAVVLGVQRPAPG